MQITRRVIGATYDRLMRQSRSQRWRRGDEGTVAHMSEGPTAAHRDQVAQMRRIAVEATAHYDVVEPRLRSSPTERTRRSG